VRASLPGLTLLKAVVVTTASTAASKFVPVGGAVGLAATFLLCRSWGFSGSAVTTSAIVTGVWNTLSRAALPIIAIGILALSRPDLPPVLGRAAWGAGASGALVLALFTGTIASARVADDVGRAVDRLGRCVLPRAHRQGRARAAMSGTRAQIIERVRSAWLWLTLGIAGFFAAQLAIFLIALHVTGIDLAFTAAFAAFAVGRMLAGVGVTPGGIGITEAGTAATLVALGADPALSAAAVIVVSIFTNLIELPFGMIAWGLWALDPTRALQLECAAGSIAAGDASVGPAANPRTAGPPAARSGATLGPWTRSGCAPLGADTLQR
jgi:uncharacterized membrane protein YbhN (UPF0104 family)